MNKNMISFFEDYMKDSEFVNSIESAQNYVLQNYFFTPEETSDLSIVAHNYLYTNLGEKKFKKLYSKGKIQFLISLFIVAFFFGMYVSSSEDWA